MSSSPSLIQVTFTRALPCLASLLLLNVPLPAAAVDCTDHDVPYPEVLGTLATEPGNQMLGLAVEGNYVYISEQYGDPGFGGYPQLSIIDVSNAASPIRLGTSNPLTAGGVPAHPAIAVDRQYVYGMTLGPWGISIVNVSNPASPTFVGRFGGNIGFYDLAIRPETSPNANDARLCVADGTFRLYALVAPGSPSLIGTSAGGDQVSATGNYAFVSNATQDALFVIDIAGPSAPSLVATVPFPTPVNEIDDQAIDGDYLYVSTSGVVHVFDVSVPEATSHLAGVETFTAGSVAATGGRAFVANCCGTAIVAGAGRGALAFVGTFPTGGGRLAVAGDRLYSARPSYVEGGLSIIDVSAPHVAPLIGRLNLPGAATSIAISTPTLLVTVHASPPLLRTIDITDPATPVMLGSVGMLSDAGDVALKDNYAFVACQGAMRVVDLSDPALPEIVATLPTSEFTRAVALTGNVACIAAGPEGLWILDVSVPTAPFLIRTVPVTNWQFMDVATADDYAYVLEGGTGLHVVDLSQPESATIIATAHINNGGATGVTTADGLVYASELDGLAIVDVTDPTSPTILGSIVTGRTPGDIAVHDQFAYAATGRSIDVCDVSNPAAPTLVGHTSAPSYPGNVAVASDVVLTAEWDLFTLPLQCPATAQVNVLSAPPPIGWLRAFPNPTPGLTTVEWSVQGLLADLGVYDAAGRLVRTLPAAASAGTRQVITWDGRDYRGRAVAGGAYWLRLDDGTSVRTSKITVLR